VGNRTRVTDPLNKDTIFTYDNLNRVKQEQNELGYSRTYAYDAVNNLGIKRGRESFLQTTPVPFFLAAESPLPPA
jgi:uncharacterized protein RhaS with RHS repeats